MLGCLSGQSVEPKARLSKPHTSHTSSTHGYAVTWTPAPEHVRVQVRRILDGMALRLLEAEQVNMDPLANRRNPNLTRTADTPTRRNIDTADQRTD